MYHARLFNPVGCSTMAVYTQLEFDEIATLAAPLAPGRLIRAEGIAAGVENTTYFLDFERGQTGIAHYVLTIAETLSTTDLEFIASLMYALNEHGLPVPAPAFSGSSFTAGRAVLSICKKPALLVPRIAGAHPQSITPDLCQRMGETLAKLHLATLEMDDQHESHRSLSWVETTGNALLPHLSEREGKLLNTELDQLGEFVSANQNLPQTIIHGDLFRDNVLVEEGRITALIDFFSAGTSYVLLDLAIVVNDWCFDEHGHFNNINYRALVTAYCGIREPHILEIQHWRQLLRIAALRFWVSRLNEQLMAESHAPRGRGKNPDPYRRLLLLHRDQALPLKL